MTVHIRPATLADLSALSRIYNLGITGRNATFETRLREGGELGSWLNSPCLVLEDSGEVQGFARGSEYSSRPCYAGILEHGVYVANAAQGRGYGVALLKALQDTARAAGYHKLTSRVFTRNDASRAAHLKAGFREVGTHLKHAQLDGQWLDVVSVEVLL